MRIGEINKVASGPSGVSARELVPAATESRALVPLAPAAPTHTITPGARLAPFLAHLLAVKDQHAQTRERRRAEPQVAIAAYRATAALTR